MSDHAALPIVADVALVNGLNDLLHREILLIAADFFDVRIVQHKKLRPFRQPLSFFLFDVLFRKFDFFIRRRFVL